jgi:hypothetical protein
MKIRRHLNYSNVMATLALLFAMSGSAVAANHYLLSSTKQISPKLLKKLKGKTGATGPAGPAGAAGAAGSTGPGGPAGPSDAFVFTSNNEVALPNTSTPFTVSLGAGKYVIYGKFEVNNNSTISARPHCTLTAGTDTDSVLAGTSPNETNDDTASATLMVGHTFASTGQVTLGCEDDGMAAKGGGTMEQVKITAIRVGTLTSTEF